MRPDPRDRRTTNDRVAVRLRRHAVGIAAVLVGSWALGVLGVFPSPPWVVPVAFVVASVVIAVAYRRFPREVSAHAIVRAGVQGLCLSAVTYATGWGSVLPVVHLFGVADNIDEGGSGTTRATLAWAATGTVAGQVAVAVGVAPLAIDDVVTSHLLAASSFLLVLLVSRRLERTARAREAAHTELVRREERFRALVEDAADVVLVLDDEFGILWSSPSTRRVLGTSLAAGASYLELVEEPDRPRVAALLADARSSSTMPVPASFRLAGVGDHTVVEGVHRDLRDNPAVGGYVASLRDVSERHRLHAAVERSRMLDPGTGLPNRRAFEQHLEAAAVGGRGFALLEVRLVGLRPLVVADGPDVVEGLLASVAGRLTAARREGDVVARTDDQSLSLLLSAAVDDDPLDRIADEVWRTALAVCREHDAALRVAVGTATSRDSADPAAVRQCVQVAVDHAAAATTPAVARFDPGMQRELQRRVAIARSIPDAIAQDQFRLVYQPICTVEDARVVGVEALVRWEHPDLGPLSPARFIPVAERTGLVVELGAWVLRTAVAQLAAWDRVLGEEAVGYVSVNVSARELAGGELPDTVRALLEEHGVEPERLVVELTESALAGDVEHAAAQLQQLSDLGVRLALDDFGTGWASMASLQRYPFDLLKVDRSFVAHAQPDRRPEVLTSIADLGRRLHLTVVAEGVEHASELDEVRSLGVELVQGWLLGRPMPPEELVVRLARQEAGAAPADRASDPVR